MAFTKKRIEVTFTLAPLVDIQGRAIAQPTFSGGKNNKVVLNGYRTFATINKTGGLYSQGQLDLRIFGLDLELMNALSTLGRTPIYVEGPQRNFVTVAAGDGDGIGLIFQGTISHAYTDASSAPDVSFNVVAFSLLYEAMLALPATSYRGEVSAATVINGLAVQMNKTFENNGVNVILKSPYYHGSALSQLQDCIKEAGIEWNNGDNGVVAIWPKGGHRGGAIPLVSPPELIGYPYPSGGGFLGLRTQFNPQLNFGARVKVESSLAPANGIWTVQGLTHSIEVEVPRGRWETSLTLTPPGYTAVI